MRELIVCGNCRHEGIKNGKMCYTCIKVLLELIGITYSRRQSTANLRRWTSRTCSFPKLQGRREGNRRSEGAITWTGLLQFMQSYKFKPRLLQFRAISRSTALIYQGDVHCLQNMLPTHFRKIKSSYSFKHNPNENASSPSDYEMQTYKT